MRTLHLRHTQALKRHIIGLKKSLAHARHDMIKEGHAGVPCLRSIHHHIDRGDIGVLRGQTPYRPGPLRKWMPPSVRAKKCPGNPVTTDNGREFLGAEALGRLFKDISATLKIYHTHAYAAWEKGTVENLNRHIRRFFPKGTDFRHVPPRDIAAAQDFINSIPSRHTLKGKTAHEVFHAAA